MQSSIEGDARMLMMLNASPDNDSHSETLRSLAFGARVNGGSARPTDRDADEDC